MLPVPRALLARWNDQADLVANAPVIMIDLAPEAVAPTTTPTEMPPDVVESKLVEPEPEPEPEPLKPVVELPPDPAPQPELTAALPPPKPVEKKVERKKRERVASVARAPSAADIKADRAAAPMPGANARDPQAMPNWTSQLVSRLRASQALSIGGAGARRDRCCPISLQRRPQRRRAQCTHRRQLGFQHTRQGNALVDRTRVANAGAAARSCRQRDPGRRADPL